MTFKSIRIRVLLPCAVGGLLVAALALRWGGIALELRTGETQDAPEATRPGRQATRGHSPSTATSAMPLEDTRPPLMPGELIEEILKEDAQLGLFMYYHERVLLDTESRKKYRELLASTETMTAMASVLMSPGHGPVEPKEHYRRMMHTDYFEAALTWKDNPQRQQLLGLTRDVILKNNFSADQDLERKQMLAGGKMELFRLLYENDEKQARDMVESAKGSAMEKLTAWMAEEELRRQAQEKEIQAMGMPPGR